MSWQKQEHVLDERFMAQAKQKLCSRKERMCMQHCSMRASFHCLVEEWKDCEENQAKDERKVGFRGKEEREYEASNRVACGSRQVSVHEMWKRK